MIKTDLLNIVNANAKAHAKAKREREMEKANRKAKRLNIVLNALIVAGAIGTLIALSKESESEITPQKEVSQTVDRGVWVTNHICRVIDSNDGVVVVKREIDGQAYSFYGDYGVGTDLICTFSGEKVVDSELMYKR